MENIGQLLRQLMGAPENDPRTDMARSMSTAEQLRWALTGQMPEFQGWNDKTGRVDQPWDPIRNSELGGFVGDDLSSAYDAIKVALRRQNREPDDPYATLRQRLTQQQGGDQFESYAQPLNANRWQK